MFEQQVSPPAERRRNEVVPTCQDQGVEVVLWHFHRSRYRSGPLWFFYGECLYPFWLFALDERGGHDNLCGSGRLSIIPYIHGRTELYFCSSLPCLSFFCFLTPVKRCLPGPFIAQGEVDAMRPGTRQVALRWLKPYTASRALMTRSS
jgi:hypothetical protein